MSTTSYSLAYFTIGSSNNASACFFLSVPSLPTIIIGLSFLNLFALGSGIYIKNKKASFEFEFIETYTAGIVLTGTEIKSIRLSKASIAEAYGLISKNEILLRNMYIQPYENGTHYNHQPRRDRKLLLNRSEINKIDRKIIITGEDV